MCDFDEERIKIKDLIKSLGAFKREQLISLSEDILPESVDPSNMGELIEALSKLDKNQEVYYVDTYWEIEGIISIDIDKISKYIT